MESVVVVMLISFFFISVYFSWTRSLVLRALPKAGEGPEKKVRDKSWFKMTFLGHTENGKKLQFSISGGDPGYDETAKMVSEAALCIALQKGALPAEGGVLTPAAAFGNVQVQRLKDAGIEFSDIIEV